MSDSLEDESARFGIGDIGNNANERRGHQHGMQRGVRRVETNGGLKHLPPDVIADASCDGGLPAKIPPAVEVLMQLGDVLSIALERRIEQIEKPDTTVMVDDDVL